jgi:hypothetical protein
MKRKPGFAGEKEYFACSGSQSLVNITVSPSVARV